MRVIGKFIFWCTLVAPQIQGVTIVGTLNEPKLYMTSVVDAFWVKIQEYGISNLPVLDTSANYNFTGFGCELIGPVYFEDGFVQDIDSVSLSTQYFKASASEPAATIEGRIVFQNLRLYRDFRAELSTGTKVGSVVFTPNTFMYELHVVKQYSDNIVVPKLSFYSVSSIVWDIDPSNLETDLLQRVYSSQIISSSSEGDLAESTGSEWIPIFTELLNEVLQTLDFPRITF